MDAVDYFGDVFLVVQICEFKTELLEIRLVKDKGRGGEGVHQVIHIVQRSGRTDLCYLNVEIEVSLLRRS